jgi:hypothetical protein
VPRRHRLEPYQRHPDADLGLQRRSQPEMEPRIGHPEGGHSPGPLLRIARVGQGVLAECRIALSACTALAAKSAPQHNGTLTHMRHLQGGHRATSRSPLPCAPP